MRRFIVVMVLVIGTVGAILFGVPNQSFGQSTCSGFALYRYRNFVSDWDAAMAECTADANQMSCMECVTVNLPKADSTDCQVDGVIHLEGFRECIRREL